MKIFIHLADIHYRKNWEENQGVVLESFFDDLNTQIVSFNKSDVYLVVSGDIVQAGEDAGLYDEFISVFGKKLDEIGIKKSNRICVPGNHDISIKDIKSDHIEHNGVLLELNEETKFNDYTTRKPNVFGKKFSNYKVFEQKFSAYGIGSDSITGKGWSLDSAIGIYCLNTAVCSQGNSAKDRDVLSIGTRNLNDWNTRNNCKCKILVMHHPLSWLSIWSQEELNAILNKNFSICLHGHIHNQQLHHQITSNDGSTFINCSAPPLFTDKRYDLGYSMISLNDEGEAQCIEYRQWSKKRLFVTGVNYSGNDTGIVNIRNTNTTLTQHKGDLDRPTVDYIGRTLSKRLEDALKIFSSQPEVWAEPTLMTYAEASNDEENEDSGPIIPADLISRPRSLIIQSPPQFGQTCLSLYLTKEAWHRHQQYWLYIDSKNLKLHSIDKAISGELDLIGLSKNEVHCVVIDSWSYSDEKSIKIIKKISERFIGIPIIVMESLNEAYLQHNFSYLGKIREFEHLYLWSLNIANVRRVVSEYNDKRHIGDVNSVITKVVTDLNVLNIHRTPLNCLTLLKVSEVEFDDSPVNRTEMIKRVLFLLFNIDEIPTYKTRPDLKDCEYVLGRFCETLIRRHLNTFTREHFLTELNNFCKERIIDLEVQVVFDVLHSNSIVIKRGNQFSFKFVYWVHYFAAQRMYQDKQFASYIYEHMHYASFPEIIEFYTGIDRSREDALKILINDMRTTCEHVEKKCALPEDLNPYRLARWVPTDDVIKQMHDEIGDGVLNSGLPDAVKDKYADRNYDRTRPYNQNIAHFMNEYSLDTLMRVVSAGARALRNSDYVDPDVKRELLSVITRSWEQISKVLVVLSPILADNRMVVYDGAGFMLTGNYSDKHEERFNQILSSIPINIVKWYKDDLYSKKMGPLLTDQLKMNLDDMAKHRFILLLINKRPRCWRTHVEQYIVSLDKNSFHLCDVYKTLHGEYRYSFAGEFNL